MHLSGMTEQQVLCQKLGATSTTCMEATAVLSTAIYTPMLGIKDDSTD